MKANYKRVVHALCLLVLFSGAVQGREITRDQLDKALAECQAERQRQLEPLRQEEIERCLESRRGDRAYCERYNRDFGEVMQTVNGTRPGLFWDLPICEQAVAAQRHFNMNPRAKAFTY